MDNTGLPQYSRVLGNTNTRNSCTHCGPRGGRRSWLSAHAHAERCMPPPARANIRLSVGARPTLSVGGARGLFSWCWPTQTSASPRVRALACSPCCTASAAVVQCRARLPVGATPRHPVVASPGAFTLWPPRWCRAKHGRTPLPVHLGGNTLAAGERARGEDSACARRVRVGSR